ncbi:unnamed protein product [Parajaminaea phylloscopi]
MDKDSNGPVDHCGSDPLESILHASGSRIGILDGGQATHLEDLGFDLSSALWSASLLADESEANRDAVRKCHTDYVAAGAQIIGTLTYQVSDLACEKARWTKHGQADAVAGLFEEALQLASSAVAGSATHTPRALVGLSLGPYGAALANGSEYTGDYLGATFDDMVTFHQHRLLQALTCPSAAAIDLIAFETLPRLDEAEAILTALAAIQSSGQVSRRPPAYLSFVFPPDCDGCLPWKNSRPADIAALMSRSAVGASPGGGAWPIVGLGVNCTKPVLMDKVVAELGASSASFSRSMALFLYPDGGLVWNAETRQWSQPPPESAATPSSHLSDVAQTCSKWTRDLWRLATDHRASWKSVWVGGCCKTGPTEIQELCRQRAAAQPTH